MKILVISPTFPPMRSGGADYALRFCQELAKIGNSVYVLTSQIEQIAIDPAVTIMPWMKNWSWFEMPKLINAVHLVNPDVINIHYSGEIYHGHPMVTVVSKVLKKLFPGVRIVTLFEYPSSGCTVNIVSRVIRRFIELVTGTKYGTLLHDSHKIIVLSSIHGEQISWSKVKTKEKTVLIPPPPITPMREKNYGLTQIEAREALNVKSDEFLLAYYGYVYPGKGLETLLEAIFLLNKNNYDLKLIIIGGSNEVLLKKRNRPYYLQELETLVRKLGLSEKVIWTGYYPSGSSIGSLYLHGSDACVLPFEDGVYLNNSSFAMAAAHGLPIVTTRGSAVEPQFENESNVLLCHPNSPIELSIALDRIVTDEAFRQKLSCGSQTLANEWFSWDIAMEKVIAAFGVEKVS